MSSHPERGAKRWTGLCDGAPVVSLCELRAFSERVAQALEKRRCGESPGAGVQAVRELLRRQCAEPRRGVSIHAHLAALVDDPAGWAAFLDEIRGLWRRCVDPEGSPETAGILADFFVTPDGDLLARGPLERWPVAILLLDRELLDALDLPAEAPIEVALGRARDKALELPVQRAFHTFRLEQNLMAVYGMGPATITDPRLCSLDPTPVLPNLRALFDTRFLSQSLGDLDLDDDHRDALDRGLSTLGTDAMGYTLDELPGDEWDLGRLDGISRETCEEVRRALLRVGFSWRFRHSGADPRLIPHGEE